MSNSCNDTCNDFTSIFHAWLGRQRAFGLASPIEKTRLHARVLFRVNAAGKSATACLSPRDDPLHP